jgi:uncharacterized Zn finger protein (UPF0148 family)
MEKFGVVQRDDGRLKTAENSAERCPKCGEALLSPDITGGIYVCPICGTEPFEELD